MAAGKGREVKKRKKDGSHMLQRLENWLYGGNRSIGSTGAPRCLMDVEVTRIEIKHKTEVKRRLLSPRSDVPQSPVI